MNAQKLKEARQQLSDEYEQLIKSIGRKRLAAEEIQIETTKDEGDLATISHEKDVLYHLHEGGFARLRFIRKALEAIDRGSYGECADCGNDINEKRLEAVPWAEMCIGCQEAKEAAQTPADLARIDAEEVA